MIKADTTADVHRCMVVPASLAPLARGLGNGLSAAGGGMFITALSPSGVAPATHYVSTGMIAPEFAELLHDSAGLYDAVTAAGAQVSLAQCTALVTQSDVSEEQPLTVFARLGLKLFEEHID